MNVKAEVELITGPVAQCAWVRDSWGRVFLVNTGSRWDRPHLVAALLQKGIRAPGDLKGIWLTHAHAHYTGNAAFLRKLFKVPIFAHPQLADFLSKESKPRAPQESEVSPAFFLDRGFPQHLREKGIQKAAQFWERSGLRMERDFWKVKCEVDDSILDQAARLGWRVHLMDPWDEGSVLLEDPTTSTLFSGGCIWVHARGGPFQNIKAGFQQWMRQTGWRPRGQSRVQWEPTPQMKFFPHAHEPANEEERRVQSRSVRQMEALLGAVRRVVPGRGPILDLKL